ncbi:prepilin peptidase [Nostoc sp. UCD121]|uniref:prepilin peptidase n=1 Tax=unclassified Nostoc TaxID=2593658 RepID=UPI001623446A|nr:MULTISPECIES: A24 family peptidase [unclassified Nostoc]MBC1219155.1 prepilin peptidase [Nostoc sp. UCD120]MBC1277445.1 prepilin peptidase [Nostoc sp. UCD121]MBC1299289.1 prepilin peptidase [Nostoc sp. UCD122]
MDILFAISASVMVFALGASIGSFLNVIVYRLPAGLSILWPPSRCPKCLNQLKAYDNVPVFGWISLRGRCRYCKSKISVRYPVVEGVTGIIFLLVFLVFQVSTFTIGYWAFCSWLLALSLIDLDTMTLPNPLTQSGLVVGILFQMVVGYLPEGSSVALVNHLMMAIVGAVLGLWLFDAIALLGSIAFGKTAMGAGDAKLAAMMGAWLGWKYLLLASFIACALGALIGSGVIMHKRILLGRSKLRTASGREAANEDTSTHRLGQKMPFGPFLALGSLITLFSGEAILSTYLRLFFPAS